MAEHVASGVGTSLREMRQRMVAEAQAIAQERRSQSGFSFALPPSANIRSAFKPVIDGSVLKNDLKQKLAKERREEKRRQQDATKEIQLLEKEIKAKIQYEKQMEEKKRKLREQKQKDEQRRLSAEEKRKQKSREEREKFQAVVSRTLERSSRIEQRQKRWSWECSVIVNSESKAVKKRSISIEKLQQEISGSDKQITPSSSGLQNSPATSIDNPAVLYTNMPLLSHSNDELKNTIVLSQSTVAVPPQEKAETPLTLTLETSSEGSVEAAPPGSVEAAPPGSVEAAPTGSVEAAPTGSVEAAPTGSVEAAPTGSVEALPEVRVEADPAVCVEGAPAVSTGALPEMNLEGLLKSLETSSESEDMSLVCVDPSPEVSIDSSSDLSLDLSPGLSVEPTSEACLEEMLQKVNMEMIPEESLELGLEESKEVPPELRVETSPESESCPEMNVRSSPQKSYLINKKHISTHTLLSRWPSSTSVWCSPSPLSANRQIQKNRLPSISPVMSKQSACKIIPAQHTLYTQNVLGTIRRNKKPAPKTTKSSEAVNQKHMTYEVESSNKTTRGIVNVEETTKPLATKRRLAREHRKEEKLRKEMEQRKEKYLAKKAFEGRESFLKFDCGQQQKEINKKEGCQDQDHQKRLLQKGDAEIQVQDEADKRKKEREKIMLKNLQERLERKKRIEEIMKRTRKTNLDTSKDTQTSSSDTYEDHEADDEDESESDNVDTLDDLHASAFINGMNSSRKLKKHFRNVKTTPRLLLEVNSDKVYTKTNASLKNDMKNIRQKVKDPLAQAKDIKLSIKRMTNQVTKTEKMVETSNTMEPTKSLHSVSQECVCDQILDLPSEIDPLTSSVLHDTQKHHQNVPHSIKVPGKK